VRFARTFVSSAYGVEHSFINEERFKADESLSYFVYRYPSLLTAGLHQVGILPNGLENIIDGVKALHAGKVSAKKLLAR
jgi:hypothetical protein